MVASLDADGVEAARAWELVHQLTRLIDLAATRMTPPLPHPPVVFLVETLAAVLGLGLLPGCTDLGTSAASASWSGTVVRVVDGDTVDALTDTGRVRIRLLGIDAPELAHDGSPAACGAVEAATALTGLLAAGTTITWAHDPRSDAQDRYGRELAYVATAQSADVGLTMLEAGLVSAWQPSSATPPTRAHSYRSAATTARREQRGSWATCTSLGR